MPRDWENAVQGLQGTGTGLYRDSFLSPELVVSWSSGLETKGYKLSQVALGTRMTGTRLQGGKT